MGTKTRLLASGQTEANEFNISLLGFKMAVNEGLTVFNLVDGVVDEFHDESGTDESEGSNDKYVAASDYYINSTTDDGLSAPGVSAGFSISAITEPDTSTTQTNPQYGVGTFGSFTVPSGVTSINLKAWAAGGGGTTNVTNVDNSGLEKQGAQTNQKLDQLISVMLDQPKKIGKKVGSRFDSLKNS